MIFINKVNNIDSCVIGVDTAKQLSEISVNLENKMIMRILSLVFQKKSYSPIFGRI